MPCRRLSPQRTRPFVAGLVALGLVVQLVLAVGIMDPSKFLPPPTEGHRAHHAAPGGEQKEREPSTPRHTGPHCLICQTQTMGLALLAPSPLALPLRARRPVPSRPLRTAGGRAGRRLRGAWARAPPGRMS